MNFSKIIDKLDTGDLLLFHSDKPIGCCIQCITKSKYCHVGMVLKDPTFINPKLTGYYLWESSEEPFPDAENEEIFYGVQITSLKKVLKEYGSGNVFYRKLFLLENLNEEKLKETHEKIHHHRYDLNIIDWIRAGIYHTENSINDNTKLLKNNKIKTPKTVWCSALIGYIYVSMGWITSEIKWKFLSPEDWAYPNDKKLGFINSFLTPDNKLF